MLDFIKVAFPDTQMEPKRVYKMSYRQRNYEHDYAKIYFRDWDVDFTKVKPGSRMLITLDNKELAGYVHDIKGYQDTNSNFTEVGFIGASYVMRQASQETFYNTTASAVVETIAKKYGFAYKIVPFPRVFKQLSQAGLTDWEFLVKLAKQCGYFVWVESTSLYFQPLLQEFEEKINEAITFTKVDAGFKTLSPLYSFNPVIGETLTHQGADKSAVSVAGVDAETGQYFKYTKQRRSAATREISQPEFFDRHATGVVVTSYEAAVYEAVGADEKSKFPYTAEAEVLGTSRIRPGSPVYLSNLGNKYSGYWTVLQVEHHLIEDQLNFYKYTSELIVATDSLGETAQAKYPTRPPARGIRHISPAVRNTRVVPKNITKTPAVSVTPAKTVKLVNRVNRPADSGPKVSQATWTSDTGNLTAKPIKPGRSPAAVTKVVNQVGRR